MCKQVDTSHDLNTLIEGTTPLAHLDGAKGEVSSTPGSHDGDYGDSYKYRFTYSWPQQALEGINTIGSGNNGDGGVKQKY